MNRNRTVIIAYHANCIDGFTSAWIARRAMLAQGYEVDTHAMTYEQVSYDDLRGNITSLVPHAVHIVDFSLPKHFLLGLASEFPQVHFLTLDHHKTAFEDWNPEGELDSESVYEYLGANNNVIINMGRSGAGMCWEYYYPELEVPPLVKFVQDWDLWRFNYGDVTKEVNAYLKSIPKTFNAWESIYLEMRDPDTISIIRVEGKNLLAKQQAEIDALVYLARKTLVPLGGHPAYYVHTSLDLASVVGNTICAKHPEYITIMWDLESLHGTATQFSLRSTGSIDVSKVARFYGGGGHKNAAGFTLPTLEALNLIQELI